MELFYRFYGKGKPIIILHGLFGMSDNWVSIAKKFAENYEVYLPDMRNHGQSPHSEVFDYEVMTDDLLGFINMHELGSPVIIGHSMGGKIAMNFALKYGSLIEKLIVVDIHPQEYNEHYEHLDLIETMQSVDLSLAKTFADIEKAMSQYLISTKIRQFLLKNIYRKTDNLFDWKFNLEAIKLNLFKLLEEVDINKTFSKPVLFIRGGLSDYIKDEDEAIIRKTFPDSEIKTIAKASHWVHADAPDEFYKLVSEFINSPE